MVSVHFASPGAKANGVYRIVATSNRQQGRGDYQLLVRQYAARPK